MDRNCHISKNFLESQSHFFFEWRLDFVRDAPAENNLQLFRRVFGSYGSIFLMKISLHDDVIVFGVVENCQLVRSFSHFSTEAEKRLR